jgi:hypothetical protein
MSNKNLLRQSDIGAYCSPMNYDLNFNYPVIMLPYYGEFGYFILWYARWANLIEAPRKTICCQRGEELYFPSATNFFYDWKNPIPDKCRAGWRDNHQSSKCGHYEPNEDKLGLIELFSNEYPDHKIIDPCSLFSHSIINFARPLTFQLASEPADHQRRWDFAHPKDSQSALKIKPLYSKIDLRVDVVIGARNRDRNHGKNLTWWGEFAKMLKDNGMSYAIIGDEDTSYRVEGASAYAWDFPILGEACVDLLQSARLYVGPNTGTAHLAALANIDMLIIDHGDKSTCHQMKLVNTKKTKVIYQPSPMAFGKRREKNAQFVFDNVIELLTKINP